MNIVVDENIPLAQECFGSLGKVTLLPGRQLRASDLQYTDVLIVRSVTKVDANLLSGSKVRFVGSCTIGVDHVDQVYLQQQGVHFVHAPGCNAQSVVDYVFAALLELEAIRDFKLQGKRVGIFGLGNVGSRLKQVCESMGLTVLACDPLLQAEGVSGLVSADEVWKADVVSLHVPYEANGRFSTHHLADRKRISDMVEGGVLINTSRGAVVDNLALSLILDERYDLSAVLDVWEGEPFINRELANQVDIATPHIAGYSYDGKVMGTWMILQALCRWRQCDNPFPTVSDLIADPLNVILDFSDQQTENPESARDVLRRVYDIREDDIGLRTSMQLSREKRAEGFDALRKHYRVRREYGTTTLRGMEYLRAILDSEQISRLTALGFQTA